MCVCVCMCVRCRKVLELLQYSIPYSLNVYFKYVHFQFFFCLCSILQHQILIRFVKERKQKQFPNFTSTSGDREALMNHVILWKKWEAAGVVGGPWDDQQYHEPMKFVCVENARIGGWWGVCPTVHCCYCCCCRTAAATQLGKQLHLATAHVKL